MIYDCFTFFNELELLRIRLNELADVVDKFVICECTTTFTGKPKPLWFDENKEQFAKWADKIVHVIDTTEPYMEDPWVNERRQRDVMQRALFEREDVKPDDIIVLSDVDEIPSAAVLDTHRATLSPAHYYICRSMLCFYQLNYYSCRWNSAKFLTASKLAALGESFSQFRNRWGGRDKIIRDAGWHLSFMPAGMSLDDSIKLKLASASHQEVNNPKDIGRIVGGAHQLIDVKGRPMTRVPIDEQYPLFVRENVEHYKTIGWIDEG